VEVSRRAPSTLDVVASISAPTGNLTSLQTTGDSIVLDQKSAQPLHIQLRNELLGQILSGQLEPGDILPSERELQATYGVSRTPVRQALADLANAGLIQTRPGKGSFVAQTILDQSSLYLSGFTDITMREGSKPSSRVLHQATESASKLTAMRLRIEPNDPILRLKRIRLADGDPVSIEETSLPLKICPEILDQDFHHASLYQLLRALNLTPTRAEQFMTADLPNDEERQWLCVERNSPVMRVERITFLADGRPIEYALSTYRADKRRFHVLVGPRSGSLIFRKS
jgi:GntR family transcriptional regulator